VTLRRRIKPPSPEFFTILFNLAAACFGRTTDNRLVGSCINFRCIYFRLKMVLRPKHVAAKLNKIVKKLLKQSCVDGNASPEVSHVGYNFV
jgi:hypothetical protein